MTDYIKKLSDVCLRLHKMANINLEQLEGKCDATVKETIQDYYLGILRRQAMITYDLHELLKNRPTENLTTPYILLRALLDDFLHLLYLEMSDTTEEDIVKINAQAHKYSFNSLEFLTMSENQVYYGKKFDYLTKEEFRELQKQFKAKKENKKFYTNIETDKFKSFMPFTIMIKKINGSENCNVARDRAFFLWKHFSGFVHYTNYSFEYEIGEDIVKWQQMDESFQYVFNSINLAFKYFGKKCDLRCKLDTYLLREMGYRLVFQM